MKSMELSKISHKSLNYNLGNIQVSVNTVTGRMILSFPDLEIGQGNFNIGINHIYNSHAKSNEIYGREVFLPYSWNISLNQSLFPYASNMNLEGFVVGNYVYVDGEGTVHRFIKYKTENDGNGSCSCYYDDSGSGLIMKNWGNISHIIDENDNIIEFNNEKVTSYISGINSEIKKIFQYQNNKLVRVYDERKSARSISIEYEGNNITKIESNFKSINYEYDSSGRLTIVSERVSESCKKLYSFSYNNNDVLESVYDYSLNQGFSFSYVRYNAIDNPGLSKRYYNDMLTGIIKFKGLLQDTYYKASEIGEYFGEDYYANDNMFLTANEKVRKNIDEYSTTLKANSKLSEIHIVYANYSTKITDVKTGIINELFFDKNYEICNNLERTSVNNFKTINKQKGIELLANSGTGPDKINGKRTYIVQNNEIIINSNILTKLIQDAEKRYDIKNNENKSHRIDYTLGFHLKILNMTNTSNIKVKCEIENENGIVSGIDEVKLKYTDYSSWQYVQVPFHFNLDEDAILSMKVKFIECNNNQIEVGCMYASDPKLVQLYYNKKNITNPIELSYEGQSIDGINIIDGSKVFNNNYVITLRDLFNTHKSMWKTTKDSKVFFDLYLNNCKEVINVKSVTFPNIRERLSLSKKFYLKEIMKTKNNEYYNKAYYYDFSNVNSNVDTMYIEEIRQFETSEMDDIPSYGYNESKEYNTKGLLTKSINVNNVQTDITYDAYGNVLYESLTGEEGTGTQLYGINYKYDSDDERKRELLLEEERYSRGSLYHSVKNIYEYEEDGSIKNKKTFFYKNDGEIETIENINDITYNYDAFNELVKEVLIHNNLNNNILNNKIKYNKFANVSTLNDNVNQVHNFNYDDEHNLTSYTRGNKIREENDYVINEDLLVNDLYLIREGSKVENKKYFNQTSPSLFTKYYDKFDRLVYETLGDCVIMYTYESDDELYQGTISNSRITSITDTYGKIKYTYEYNDEDNSVKIYQDSLTNGAKHFKIVNHNNGLIEYNFEPSVNNTSDKFGRLISYYDSNEGLPYKICYFKTTSNANSLINDFCYEYEYDSVNRESKRETGKNISTGEIIFNNKIFKNYKFGGNFVSDIRNNCEVKIKDINTGKYNNTYSDFYLKYDLDNRGNIKQEKLEGTCLDYSVDEEKWITKNIPVSTTDFLYDGYNRIISETRNGVSRTYTYDNKNNLVSISENGNLVKTFLYTSNNELIFESLPGKNKLIEYDNYGNMISYDNKLFTYDLKGNLINVEYYYNNTLYDDEYGYNIFGQRIKKITKHNNLIVTKEYFYDNEMLLGENISVKQSDVLINEKKIRYFYDKNGIAGMLYNNIPYDFVKDGLGNVRWIMHNNVILAEYVYDAWGNHSINYYVDDSYFSEFGISKEAIVDNPFRYKGYYYDVETQLFYCNSRYYSPELGRFIQPADILTLKSTIVNGLNLYFYNLEGLTRFTSLTNVFEHISLIKKNFYRNELALKLLILAYRQICANNIESKKKTINNSINSSGGNSQTSSENKESFKGFLEPDSFNATINSINTQISNAMPYTGNNTSNYGEYNKNITGGTVGGRFAHENDDLLDVLLEDVIW